MHKKLKIILPKKIINDIETFNYIQNSFNELIENKQFSTSSIVIIDFQNVEFCSGEITPFLAINCRVLQQHGFTVKFSGKRNDVYKFFNKNGFFKSIIESPDIQPDTYHTTIPFMELPAKDINVIFKYLDENLFPKIKSKMNNSQSSEDSFISSISELTENVTTHSESKLITICGQYYPKLEKLGFSICDNGITIPSKILQTFPTMKTLYDHQLIDWSTQKGNSTKSESYSGLGLFDTIESIMNGKGLLTIFSSHGYWKIYKNGKIISKDINAYFPGTIVLFEISTKQNDNDYKINDNIDTPF